ncbi:MAG: class I SAM-dependent methyltransferase [Firmicutes bacterium]|nr:class I SAM-dependent methyltransferase [Bacillota bacterium]
MLKYTITTSERASEESRRLAADLAEKYRLELVARRGKSIQDLVKRSDNGLFVVDNNGLLTFYGDPPLEFHPGMAHLRVLGLIRGRGDRLVEVCGVKPGWRVLDCTAGLCADSAVLSWAAGQKGEVVALEASFPIFLVVQAGICRYPFPNPVLAESYRRIKLVHTSYRRFLAGQEENSYDLVYFDPMFEQPVKASSGIAPLRQVACYEPLDKAALKEALRVSAQKVVVKNRKESSLWDELEPDHLEASKGSRIAYGVFTK